MRERNVSRVRDFFCFATSISYFLGTSSYLKMGSWQQTPKSHADRKIGLSYTSSSTKLMRRAKGCGRRKVVSRNERENLWCFGLGIQSVAESREWMGCCTAIIGLFHIILESISSRNVELRKKEIYRMPPNPLNAKWPHASMAAWLNHRNVKIMCLRFHPSASTFNLFVDN